MATIGLHLPSEEQIRKLAYEIWEYRTEEGLTEEYGYTSQRNWEDAEQILLDQLNHS